MSGRDIIMNSDDVGANRSWDKVVDSNFLGMFAQKIVLKEVIKVHGKATIRKLSGSENSFPRYAWDRTQEGKRGILGCLDIRMKK